MTSSAPGGAPPTVTAPTAGGFARGSPSNTVFFAYSGSPVAPLADTAPTAGGFPRGSPSHTVFFADSGSPVAPGTSIITSSGTAASLANPSAARALASSLGPGAVICQVPAAGATAPASPSG